MSRFCDHAPVVAGAGILGAAIVGMTCWAAGVACPEAAEAGGAISCMLMSLGWPLGGRQ